MPPPGKRLAAVGNYSLDRRVLGRGTFAKVELATHTILETKVALKIMWRSSITDVYVLRNLMREANILARLRHPNVVRLIEICDDGKDLFCLVLEYIDGGTLFELVFDNGKVVESEAKLMLGQLAKAIAFLHTKNFVHRDLKMENVMVDSKTKRVVVVDFGLSNLCHPNKRLMTHCGSAEYAAPELFVRNSVYTKNVDVWSFGVIAFATMLGFLPFQRDEQRESMRVLKTKIAKGLTCDHLKHMATLSADARLIIMRALDVNRRTRMQSAQLEMDIWFSNSSNSNGHELQKAADVADGLDNEEQREVAERLRLRFNPKMTVEQILGHVKHRAFARTAGCFNIMCLQNEREREARALDMAFMEDDTTELDGDKKEERLLAATTKDCKKSKEDDELKVDKEIESTNKQKMDDENPQTLRSEAPRLGEIEALVEAHIDTGTVKRDTENDSHADTKHGTAEYERMEKDDDAGAQDDKEPGEMNQGSVDLTKLCNVSPENPTLKKALDKPMLLDKENMGLKRASNKNALKSKTLASTSVNGNGASFKKPLKTREIGLTDMTNVATDVKDGLKRCK